ncbi:protein of unknown function [Pseudomonas sp. JV551A1]|uniref:Uncharacterized protein n=1 Tax=Pseudomonas inefficax TaxID=2078786 RepID=A0AAQ1ST98_9PSED|nr:protein of unknown function [Pseudomonas sp. JV551A1]SPO60777.1 protein of unknown function [Pseudomonas inefficax]
MRGSLSDSINGAAMQPIAGKPAPTRIEQLLGLHGPCGSWLACDGPQSGPMECHIIITPLS